MTGIKEREMMRPWGSLRARWVQFLFWLFTLSYLFFGRVWAQEPSDTTSLDSLSRVKTFPWNLLELEKEVPRIDYKQGLVFFERWRDSLFFGVIKVLPLSSYLALKMQKDFTQDLGREIERAQIKKEKQAGFSKLIPEIEIPKIPLIGESRINIAGENRVTIGGRQTILTGGTQTSYGQSLLPELKMEQALRLNLEGTISDRTKVLIDHDSQRELEAKNRVKLEYTGGEDDIIKKIEMGETQLTIPGTAFTGDIPVHKGLFGISGQGELGGLKLNFIASREQSQPQMKEFKGKNLVAVDTFYDNEFAKDRFFLLDTQPVQVKEIYLYYDDNQPYGIGKESCLATIRPEAPEDTLPNPNFPGDRKISRFLLLEPNKDYKIQQFVEGGIFLEMLRDVRSGRLGVFYITTTGESIGGKRFQGALVLKLIKAYPFAPESKTWPNALRNIYILRQGKVKLEEIKIFRDDPQVDMEVETDGPEKGKTFLQITGLDPDGDRQVVYPQFISTLGYIVFPYFKPFAHPGLSLRDTIIYYRDQLMPGEGKRYYIVVRYTALAQTISLGVDIEKNEKVYVNGELQERDKDYRVDYDKGEIIFLKPLPPDAEVKVTYEYLPLFMAQARSLLGVRAEQSFLEEGKIGSSIFYRSEASPQTKPSLGSEPFQRMVWEGDIAYRYRNLQLPNIIDRLPLVRAESPLEVSLTSEVATSLPNPNTFGVVYVDDFEQTIISEKTDFAAGNWQTSSCPVGRDTSTFAKKRLIWLNPPQRIRKDSIFGPRVREDREEKVDYLRIIFEPDNTASWAGMMTALRGGVDIRNLENLEGIFRTRQKEGKIWITLATSVEEDAPRRNGQGEIVGYNNYFDTEDKNNNGQLDVNLGEDSGIDTVLGKDGTGVVGDDGNDDYDPYRNPQGSEGNRRLDSEDVDGNGFSPRGDNNYYEYEISLSDTTYFTNLVNNWRIFRMPLSRWTKKVGIPLDQEIRVVRIWFTGFLQPETVDFYSLELTGSKWRGVRVVGERRRDDYESRGDTLRPELGPDTLKEEIVKIYQISIENDTSYNSPFKVKRDAFGQREKEASLALLFKNLRGGRVVVIPQLFYEKQDWRDYKALKIYVHRDLNTNPIFFLRVGRDSTNYYYYRSFIDQGRKIPGTDGLWYEFEISLDSFQRLKVEGRENANYGYIGNPTFSEVWYIALGIENPSPDKISGSVWFNDLRLVSPYREMGLGYQAGLRFTLSDLASFGVSLSYLDPNFVRLSEAGGVKTGNYTFSRGYSYNVNLDRFLPASWQLHLPFRYTQSAAFSTPKFAPLNPDKRLRPSSKDTIEVNEVKKAKGAGGSESWGLSISKGKSSNKILNYTLDALSYSWSRRKGYNGQLLATDTSSAVGSGANYAVSPNLYFAIGENEIYYFPQNIQIGINYSRSKSLRKVRAYDSIPWARADSLKDSTKMATLSFGTSYSPIENLSFDYSEGSGRDLYGIREDHQKLSRFGAETDKDRNFGANYSFELGDIIQPRLEYDGSYSETRMKKGDTISNKRNFNNMGEYSIEGDLNLPELFSKLHREDKEKKKAVFGSPQWLLEKIAELGKIIEPIDLSYSVSRSSEFPTANFSPPLFYQLGLIDQFTLKGETIPRTPTSKETDNRFSASSHLKLGNIGISYSYDYSQERSFTGKIGNATFSRTWPSLSITISRVERFFRKLASSSNLTTGFQKTTEQSGTLLPNGKLSDQGKRIGQSNSFSPLISWQTTWQKRVNTNFSLNYSFRTDEIYQVSRTETKGRGGDFSISHALSFPRGVKIPFLPRIRLTHELSLTWNVGYSRNESYEIRGGSRIPTQSNENISTRLSTSYRISTTIESGFNVGYNSWRNLLSQIRSQSIELNFWVLFRF